ncbi:MAG: 30S ribosome-binding factor RbfA [Alphaproteobacteria bacterium]|jgi:ribosome-binding factor A|nr:30S ribosome-binding factor RbfA [Alphaproteobacteria bacterium]
MAQKEYSERQLKVAENLKRIIANNINIDKSLLPVIGDIYMTVSEVRMSPDLKSARVYILPNTNADDTEQIVDLVNEFSYLIKKSVAKSAKLKYVPRLRFVNDKLFDHANKIENLIGDINCNE